MFVDDEPDQLFCIKELLKDADGDYDFIGVDSGEKCITQLKNGVIPDIIFLDIMMPEMSGWEVYDKIRDNPIWNSIPIVFLTARTDRIAENVSEFLGDDYMKKPIEGKQIIECIKRNTIKE